MELTRKSVVDFHNKYNGFGVLFAKIGDRELQIIEFNLDRNGKFHTMNGTELTERLNELALEITEREDAEERQESYLHHCATAAAYQLEEEKELEQAGDLIESMILDSWKREGGIHKRAAEEYEKETDLYKQAVKELEEDLNR